MKRRKNEIDVMAFTDSQFCECEGGDVCIMSFNCIHSESTG